jgi:hypothetical protein
MTETDPVSEIGGLVGNIARAIFLFIIAPFLPDAKV